MSDVSNIRKYLYNSCKYLQFFLYLCTLEHQNCTTKYENNPDSNKRRERSVQPLLD